MTTTNRFARVATAFASALLLLVTLVSAPEIDARSSEIHLLRLAEAMPAAAKSGDHPTAATLRAKHARTLAAGGDGDGLVPSAVGAERPPSRALIRPYEAAARVSYAFTAFRARAPPSNSSAA